MKSTFIKLCMAGAALAAGSASAQLSKIYSKEGLKVYLSEDSVRYIKGTGMVQAWLRYNQSNPGSTIFGTPKSETFDVGLRRVRYQVFAQVSERAFFYTQFGINNQNNLAPRKMPMFLHDATGEYNIYKNWFVLGAGLSGWNGTSRYSSSSVNSILGMDLPAVEETTNDVSDQFVRKMGVFLKGKISGFDYRLSVSNPLPVQTATTAPGINTPAALTGTNSAAFSTKAPELNYQGYFMWQFLDKESNQVPYMVGSYLGKKRVLNIGAGFEYQPDAMWYRNDQLDTLFKPLQQFGVDVFYDYYLNKEKQNAITAYAAFLNYNFGPNYIRNAGPMPTANGVAGFSTFNGAGTAFPLIGTGQVVYVQAAYLLRKDLFGKQGTLQPYVQATYASYEALKDPVKVLDVGVNWIMSGQNSKLSLDYQSRPVYAKPDADGNIYEIKSARRGMLVLQYQVCF